MTILKETVIITLVSEFNCNETIKQRNILLEAFEVLPLSNDKLEEFHGIINLYDCIIDQMYEQNAVALEDE